MSNPDDADGPPPEPIGLDEVETYLCCPRRYQYAHRQEIGTRTTQDAIDARTERYRDIITSTLAAHSGAAVTTDVLRETARTQQRRPNAAAADSRSRAAGSHRRYDRASVRNAIATYVDEYGQAHAEGAIAIDETYRYTTGGYSFACPVDCCWVEDGSYEIARFVTTLDGIVWANPYSDPVADYRDGEGFYPRQVGSILRAYATIHAVATAHELNPHNVSYRYYAIAEETHPSYEADGRAGPEVVSASRDVTETCWEADAACPGLLTEVAAGLTADDGWSATGDRWAEIVATSCRHCSYQSMCLDYINEEVQF